MPPRLTIPDHGRDSNSECLLDPPCRPPVMDTPQNELEMKFVLRCVFSTGGLAAADSTDHSTADSQVGLDIGRRRAWRRRRRARRQVSSVGPGGGSAVIRLWGATLLG